MGMTSKFRIACDSALVLLTVTSILSAPLQQEIDRSSTKNSSASASVHSTEWAPSSRELCEREDKYYWYVSVLGDGSCLPCSTICLPSEGLQGNPHCQANCPQYCHGDAFYHPLGKKCINCSEICGPLDDPIFCKKQCGKREHQNTVHHEVAENSTSSPRETGTGIVKTQDGSNAWLIAVIALVIIVLIIVMLAVFILVFRRFIRRPDTNKGRPGETELLNGNGQENGPGISERHPEETELLNGNGQENGPGISEGHPEETELLNGNGQENGPGISEGHPEETELLKVSRQETGPGISEGHPGETELLKVSRQETGLGISEGHPEETELLKVSRQETEPGISGDRPGKTELLIVSGQGIGISTSGQPVSQESSGNPSAYCEARPNASPNSAGNATQDPLTIYFQEHNNTSRKYTEID